MTSGSRGREPEELWFDEAVSVTDFPAYCEAWREDFGASVDWVKRDDIQLPRGAALRELCVTFGFPEIAVHDLVDQRDTWDDARIRRLGAHVQWLTSTRYSPSGYIRLGWPATFSNCPLFYAYAALGLTRRVAARHAALGIEVEITHATLRDIGQQVALHRRVYGVVGMNKGWWLCHHLNDHLFCLGRLQFQRARAPRALGPIAAGEPFLDVHIPEAGALDSASCDASLMRALPFFAKHFPAELPRFHACASWLLDPLLAEWLPPDSNIVRFQRLFDIHEQRDGPSSVFEFVFDRPDLDRPDPDRSGDPELSRLPRDSRLRAAILDHYACGGTIRMGVGTRAA